MKSRVIIIAIIAVIIFGGGSYAFRQLIPQEEKKDAAPIYATQEVKLGDLTVGVEVSGPLNPSYGGGIQVPGGYGNVDSTGITSYVIDQVFVKPGDFVEQGQIMVQLNAPGLPALLEDARKQLQDEKRSLAVLTGMSVDNVEEVDPSKGIVLSAPIDGRVIDLEAVEGKEVKEGEIVARIVDDSRFEVLAKLTAGEFNQLTKDQAAVLNFSQYFNGFVEAEIIDINPNPVPESSQELTSEQAPGSEEENYEFVYWVTLQGENPGLVRPGMKPTVGFLAKEDAKKKPIDLTKIRWSRYYASVEKYVGEEPVLSQAESIVTKVFVHKMEYVTEGKQLISMAGQDVQETIRERLDRIREKKMQLKQLEDKENLMQIRAPIQGVVADFGRKAGEMCQPGEWLGSIYQATDMRMWTQVDDIDILLVKQGAPVEISVDAVPGKKFSGTVEQVATMGKDQNGVARFEVSIKVSGGPELRPGMQGKAYINAGSVQGVLLIPVEAVFQEDGQNKVEILQEDGIPKLVPVELGLMNDRLAEVKSGLKEGDKVITGSSADLLPSQKIQSDTLLPGKQENDSEDENSGEKN